MATLTKPGAVRAPSGYSTASVQPAINLESWIEANRDKFKPPVSNRYLYDGRDFFVMVIKGPNARNDFHKVDSEEYFYQLKGDIKVRIREGDRIVDHLVREGETFFIPPNVPHAPVRPPGIFRDCDKGPEPPKRFSKSRPRKNFLTAKRGKQGGGPGGRKGWRLLGGGRGNVFHSREGPPPPGGAPGHDRCGRRAASPA